MDRKKIFIFIVAVLIILFIILAIYFLINQEDQKNIPDNKEAEVVVDRTMGNNLSLGSESPSNIIVPVVRDLGIEDISKMASAFAERFGSYSNHSNFKNISDLEIFMTGSMKEWSQKIITESSATYEDPYYGITTKTITTSVEDFDEDLGRAIILVKTQRKESLGTIANSSIYYQDIIITYVKERGVWKVDSAYWQ